MGTEEIIVLALQYGLKYGPEGVAIVRKFLAMKTLPTDAEWAELDTILLKTGQSYFDPKVPA